MAEEDLIDKLKKLAPKERIAKLKELQKKDEEEIKKAQMLITESEDQAEREEEAEKIPIPALKSVDIESLFSSEAKELFKTKRYASDFKEETTEESPVQKPSLEEVAAQAPKLSFEEEKAHAEYLNQLSQAPANQLKEKVSEIYNIVKESGYMSHEQQEELNNIHYANQRKLDDIQAGKYTDVNKEVADAMIVTEKMKNWLQSSYKK